MTPTPPDSASEEFALVQEITDLPDDPHIDWVSPLARDNYAEYRDDQFLNALQLRHLVPQLVGNFWPRGGPCWDALAIVRSSTDPTHHGILLVEAKSHLEEVYGTGCQAGPHSLPRILQALSQTATAANTLATPAWTARLYQTANRLAHLHFFREMARLPAWLVDISFINDPYKPTTRAQWEAFLPSVWKELGIDPDQIAGRCGLFLDPLPTPGAQSPTVDPK